MSEPIQRIQTFVPQRTSDVCLVLSQHASHFRPAVFQAIVDGRWKDQKLPEENLTALIGAYYGMTQEERAPIGVAPGISIKQLKHALHDQIGPLRETLAGDTWWLIPCPTAETCTDRYLELRFTDAGSLYFCIHDHDDQRNPIEIDWTDMVEQTGGDLRSFWDLTVQLQWDVLEQCAQQSRIKRLPAGSGAW
jgi:hypothetical protein